MLRLHVAFTDFKTKLGTKLFFGWNLLVDQLKIRLEKFTVCQYILCYHKNRLQITSKKRKHNGNRAHNTSHTSLILPVIIILIRTHLIWSHALSCVHGFSSQRWEINKIAYRYCISAVTLSMIPSLSKEQGR